MTHGDEGFVWTPSARRSVNVLVAMQAMHLCATQVVMLASDDLLLNVTEKNWVRVGTLRMNISMWLKGSRSCLRGRRHDWLLRENEI